MKNPQTNSKGKLKLFLPVVKNNWVIKFSILDDNVLLIIFSMSTGQTIVRYFDNEDGACSFINYILLQNADDIVDLSK